jgi:hypothetical protein
MAACGEGQPDFLRRGWRIFHRRLAEASYQGNRLKLIAGLLNASITRRSIAEIDA